MSSRRTFLKQMGGLAIVGGWKVADSVPAIAQPAVRPVARRIQRITLGYSLIGMRGVDPFKAIRATAEIGYSAVELPVSASWPFDPAALSRADRLALAQLLDDESVELASLREKLVLLASPVTRSANLDHLSQASNLARDLVPETVPTISTPVGGGPGEWDERRTEIRDELGRWSDLAHKHAFQLCVEPRYDDVLATPEQATWLMEQLGEGPVQLAFDYSQFERQQILWKPCLRKLAPWTALVHTQDNRFPSDEPEDAEAALTGEGNFNYVEYLKGLKNAGYSGAVVADTSRSVLDRDGYDALAAAAKSYRVLHTAFLQAGLRARA